MNKGTVKKIVELEKWNEYFKWEVTVSDDRGEAVYSKFNKENLIFFSVNDVITFETNDKGSMIKAKKFEDSEQPPAQPYFEKSYEPQINKQKQLSIERQSSLKLAFDFLANQRDKFTEQEVIWLAGYWVQYIETGQVPEGPVFGGKEEPKKEEPKAFNETDIVDDLPF